jgi:hypothetical protein
MPANPDEVKDNALQAIELLTAWAGGGRSTDFLAERVRTISYEQGHEGVVRSMVGLINVSGYMLVWLSKLTGKPEEEVLQAIALNFHGRK